MKDVHDVITCMSKSHCEIRNTASRPEYEAQEDASVSSHQSSLFLPNAHSEDISQNTNMGFRILTGGKEEGEFIGRRDQWLDFFLPCCMTHI